jgi:hypothetical protein
MDGTQVEEATLRFASSAMQLCAKHQRVHVARVDAQSCARIGQRKRRVLLRGVQPGAAPQQACLQCT